MMKHATLISWILAGVILLGAIYFMQSERTLGAGLTTFQGGTGTTSPSGLLYGDESIRLKTVTIGSNLTFAGGTLSATGGGGSTGLSTTTPIADSNILTYSASGAGAAYGTATSSITINSPLTESGTAGSVVGGSGWTLDVATTTNSLFTGTAGQILAYLNNGWTGAATTTFNSPLNYSGGAVTLDTSGAWSGTAGSLAANGGNCAAGSYPLGVDASGAVESCTDATTEIDSAISTHAGSATAHQALVTLAGALDYLTLSGQEITRNAIDLATDITGTLGITNGGTGTSTAAVPGQILSWVGSNWQGVATTTFSTGLTYSDGNVTFDGGSAPGGELGGTWASPTIDDSLAVSSWNLTSPTLTTFFGTPCTGQNFLQDISDTGAFSCGAATGGGVDGYDFSYAQDVGFGQTGSATSTLTQFTQGIHASSTSQFSNATTTQLSVSDAFIYQTAGGGGTTRFLGAAALDITDSTQNAELYLTDGTVQLANYTNGTLDFLNSSSNTTIFNFESAGNNTTLTIPNLSGSPALGSFTTGFLDGYIPFGVSGLLATSTNLIWDNAGSNLGIGTTTPFAPLSVLTDSNSRAIVLEENSGGEYKSLDIDSQGELNIRDDDGNIHLTLDENGNLKTRGGQYGDLLDTDSYLSIGVDDITIVSGNVQFLSFDEGTQDELQYNEFAGDIDFRWESAVNSNALFFRGSDGFLGIGTSTPASLLDVYSTATTTVTWDSSSATQGACIKVKDMDGGGYTYLTTLNGTLTASVTSCE